MNLLVVFELEKDNSRIRPVRLEMMYLSSDPTRFYENVQFLEATINEAMVNFYEDGVTKVKVRQIVLLKG